MRHDTTQAKIWHHKLKIFNDSLQFAKWMDKYSEHISSQSSHSGGGWHRVIQLDYVLTRFFLLSMSSEKHRTRNIHFYWSSLPWKAFMNIFSDLFKLLSHDRIPHMSIKLLLSLPAHYTEWDKNFAHKNNWTCDDFFHSIPSRFAWYVFKSWIFTHGALYKEIEKKMSLL